VISAGSKREQGTPEGEESREAAAGVPKWTEILAKQDRK